MIFTVSERERREILGSPIFEDPDIQLAANGVAIIDYAGNPLRNDHTPLDELEFTNESSNKVKIEVGNVATKTTSPGTTTIISNKHIHTVKLTEMSGTAITEGLSIVAYRKPLDEDKKLREDALNSSPIKSILRAVRFFV